MHWRHLGLQDDKLINLKNSEPIPDAAMQAQSMT